MNLLPCPFCGGIPHVHFYPADDTIRYADRFAIQCEYTGAEIGCGAEGQHNKIKEIAIDAWNTRTTPPPDPSEDICHICKKPKDGIGGMFCNYPHPNHEQPSQVVSAPNSITCKHGIVSAIQHICPQCDKEAEAGMLAMGFKPVETPEQKQLIELRRLAEEHATWNFEIEGTVHVVSCDREDIERRVAAHNMRASGNNLPFASIVAANEFAYFLARHPEMGEVK